MTGSSDKLLEMQKALVELFERFEQGEANWNMEKRGEQRDKILQELTAIGVEIDKKLVLLEKLIAENTETAPSAPTTCNSGPHEYGQVTTTLDSKPAAKSSGIHELGQNYLDNKHATKSIEDPMAFMASFPKTKREVCDYEAAHKTAVKLYLKKQLENAAKGVKLVPKGTADECITQAMKEHNVEHFERISAETIKSRCHKAKYRAKKKHKVLDLTKTTKSTFEKSGKRKIAEVDSHDKQAATKPKSNYEPDNGPRKESSKANPAKRPYLDIFDSSVVKMFAI